MAFMLDLPIKKLSPPISYHDKIMLMGSCFTEHIGNTLADLKFSILQNPNGILFGPDAVCKSLLSYIEDKKYTEADLFNLNELWTSWDHHSRYSHPDKEVALQLINESQNKAHHFLRNADWLIITLGSSFSYGLTSNAETAGLSAGEAVANCHRAPASWFDKRMMQTDEIKSLLRNTIEALKKLNPGIKIIFTISPVRHIRDGLINNNRSKARLIEAVQEMEEQVKDCNYFPAFELVTDVLRDYRFYDTDMVHPNYAATEFVLEKFAQSCMEEETILIMAEIKRILIARKHKAVHPSTEAHRLFLTNFYEKARALQERYSFIDLSEEIKFFKGKTYAG